MNPGGGVTYVDTSALYAVLDRDDANHRAAGAGLRELLSRAEPLVTTNYIVLETAALVQRRLGLPPLRAFLRDLLPAVRLHWMTETEHSAAVAALLVANRRGLSLVDCASFEVMRQMGIARAFAFDRHFREQGFELV